MKKYARVTNFNGKGMNEGYCFNDGEYYCETEEQAKFYIEGLGLDWKEELLTFNTKDEWFYWTDWYDQEADIYYDINGCEINNKKDTLFAIYKKGVHLGNELGENKNDAIRKYLIASLYEIFLKDLEFVSLYSAKKAVKRTHFL
ncbi:hypothetical protein [Polaribacter butkevichii]|uniref:Uncharacterized protein n=1 Tax=Polaribacter butkevichii TaxID=218490 RepID=A0A2P6CBD1_9FLAO|nr:hypothetical protein [Polaribacter butkevichii]PQJ72222.1 hypothetical protein BTO14_02690 [Polaribacter butkevichii]